MNIIIADDHELIREGLKKVINKHQDIKVIGEACSSDELFSLLYQKEPDVIVLDITMPGRTGLDILLDIKELFPNVKVLLLSMHPEESFAMRGLKAGAKGYLSKQTAAEELVNALRKIMGGGKYISPKLAEYLVAELENEDKRPLHEILSTREFEILRMISQGLSVGIIAKELSLSVNTITSYRSRLLDKMRMKSNAELIRYSIEHQII